MLYFEVLTDLLSPSLIFLGKMADSNDVLFNGGVQLLLENGKNVSRADEPVPVTVV